MITAIQVYRGVVGLCLLSLKLLCRIFYDYLSLPFLQDTLDKGLITGNPLYEAGGSIELLEEIPD